MMFTISRSRARGGKAALRKFVAGQKVTQVKVLELEPGSLTVCLNWLKTIPIQAQFIKWAFKSL